MCENNLKKGTSKKLKVTQKEFVNKRDKIDKCYFICYY